MQRYLKIQILLKRIPTGTNFYKIFSSLKQDLKTLSFFDLKVILKTLALFLSKKDNTEHICLKPTLNR